MEYFEESFWKISFHGLSYLGDKNAPGFKKIFWFVIFLAGLFLFIFFAKHTISEFLSAKTKIQIEETHADLSEVVFPSVIVCNNNPFRKSFVYWIIDRLEEEGDLDADHSITDGLTRKLTEQHIFDLIRKVFFEGPTFVNESINTILLT